MSVFETVKQFLDKIFSVPLTFLDLCIEKLGGLSLVTRQGLNFNQYMVYVFGDLPREWQLVVSSLVASLVLLISLLIIRTLLRVYFAAKEGVQWW